MIKFKKIKGNLIHKTAVMNWKKIVIGKGNIIGPYVIIGNEPQWKNKKSIGKIYIGDKNIFNEFCNIHLPTSLKKKTVIGNNNYFMNSTTIDHDCHIEDNVVLSSNVILGGNIHVMKNSNIGMKSLIHQNQVVGSFTMIGMGSLITKKISLSPGNVFYGRPAKKIKKNNFGLKLLNVSNKSLQFEKLRFKKIKKKK